ncbi:Leucine zipper transcription factor-like protein 1 [Ilyodon furcidens]|uniref:Leucine zipper transcription factor-like protein 1 n=1 Tax=Ilyodon furcidens TaxID=33524 RepID=A0ABV0U6A3_9TELE
MADFGFNEHHQNEIINYMRFARSKRLLRLKTIDSCFEELKDSRLVEETFTVDEVREMLDGLQMVVRGEVEMELINTAHTNVLLLRQLFSQAEKFYLRLQSDISELENRELLEQVAEFEKTDFKTTNKMNLETSKPKLAPLNEGGVSELLNKKVGPQPDAFYIHQQDPDIVLSGCMWVHSCSGGENGRSSATHSTQ